MKKKKVVPKLRQEVKVEVDIVTSDDIKIYYTGKFQVFTARYIIKEDFDLALWKSLCRGGRMGETPFWNPVHLFE